MKLYIVIEFDFFQPHIVREVHSFTSHNAAREVLYYLQDDGICATMFESYLEL